MKKIIYTAVFFLLIMSVLFISGDVFACTGDWDCEWQSTCSGDIAEVTEYTCDGGTCVSGTTTTEDATDYNYEFCSGDDVWRKLHTCETNTEGEVCIVEYDEELVTSCSGICKDDSGVYCVNPPTVSTDSATNIYTNQVTLEANLDSLGDNSSYSDVYFEWGEKGSGMANTTAIQTKTTTGAFSQDVSGLSPNTTYEFRAVAKNDGGTTYGSTLSVTTKIDNPSVATTAATNVQTQQADLNGELQDLGGAGYVTVWFKWGESGTGMKNTTRKEDKISTGSFTNTISGLDLNKVYEFQAVSNNDSGTVYGDILSFTTDGALPRVYTLSTVDINLDTGEVTLRGDLTYTGGYDQASTYFEWGPTTNLENKTSLVERGEGSFSETININIQFGERYYYRAVAENSSGVQQGDIRDFVISKNEGTIILELDEDQKEIKVLEDGRIEIID